MGPELEIVVLSMSLEEQKARIRGRHEGNEDAVRLMEVIAFKRDGHQFRSCAMGVFKPN